MHFVSLNIITYQIYTLNASAHFTSAQLYNKNLEPFFIIFEFVFLVLFYFILFLEKKEIGR